MADDMQQMLNVAMQLMKIHAGTANSVARTAVCIAGGIIQLRSHERGLEHHDDIVAVLKDDLITFVEETYQKFMFQLQEPINYDDNAAVERKLDTILAIPYRQDVSRLTEKYIPAFTVSGMAKYILKALSNNIGIHFNDNARWLIALMTMATYASKVNAITNPLDELIANVGKSLSDTVKQTVEEINFTFERATPQLDALAIDENRTFTYFIKEGFTSDQALIETQKKFEARIRQIMNGSKKQDDTAD